jgi:hypothetical protein
VIAVAPVLLRAVAWRALLGLSVAGGVTGAAAVFAHSGPSLLVLQLSMVVIGSAAACALDEPAAAVVGACPVRRSTLVALRAFGALVPAGVGAGVLVAWWARGDVERVLGLELAGCWVLGFALAVLARARLDEPAEVVASGLALVLMSVLLVNPIGRRLVLFPDDDQLARGVRTWWVVIVGCAVAVVAVVRERRWRLHPSARRPAEPSPADARKVA